MSSPTAHPTTSGRRQIDVPEPPSACAPGADARPARRVTRHEGRRGRGEGNGEGKPPIHVHHQPDDRHAGDPSAGLAQQRPCEDARTIVRGGPLGRRGEAAGEHEGESEANRHLRGRQCREGRRRGAEQGAGRERGEAPREEAPDADRPPERNGQERRRQAREPRHAAELASRGRRDPELPGQLGEDRRDREEGGLDGEQTREQHRRDTWSGEASYDHATIARAGGCGRVGPR